MTGLRTIIAVFGLVWPSVLIAAETGLEQARQLLLKGKYAEAEEILAPLAAKDTSAAIGLARCLESRGKADQALKTLASLADKQPEIEAELARLAFARGDWREAGIRAEQSVRLAPASVLGRLVLANLARAAGRLEEAEQGYRRLIDYYNDHDVKQADTLRWIGQATAEYARWNRLSDQFDFLVNELYPEARKHDPLYWPAHLEAGLLFLEKHNHADAVKEFNAALELNPQAAEVHAALAAVAVERYDVGAAEAALRRALEINPQLLRAWQLKADLLWANFQTRETLQLLQEKALPLNSLDEETLGRIAACYVVLDGLPGEWESRGRGTSATSAAPNSSQPALEGTRSKSRPEISATRFEKLVREVATRNAHAGTFFNTLARVLEERNKQGEAEIFFREAIRVMPRHIGSHAGLGMLFMRAGQEDGARPLLKEAFAADPFNVRVKNTLEILDVLDGMQITTSRNFTFKHSKADALLARYAVPRLEAMLADLSKEFGYAPPGKSLVEVFNEARGQNGHAWFSARMVGLPYLGTVAASTGRIVAMTSPNETGLARRFNWARVLRHEMVHVITLQQTKFNIPHWFTEGLAVRAEAGIRPYRWRQLLRRRAAQSTLFNLTTINFGFARPGSGEDWQLAYCQAELYVEYLLARGGSSVVRDLLAAYAEGLTTREAIQRVLAVSPEEFEKGYVEHVKKVIDDVALLRQPPTAGLDELLKIWRDHAGDADAAADLAYAHLQRGADREAVALAQAAIRLRPRHALATYVLARVRIAEGKHDEAVVMLETCLDRKAPEPLSLNLLAGLKLKAKRHEEAAALYALGEQCEPDNPKWTAARSRVYLLADKKQELSDALARLARLDADDLAARKKLAELARARGDCAAAVDWANQALEIDVKDSEVHRLLADALVGQRQWAQAIEEYETAIELDPTRAALRLALAETCVQAKQSAKARQVLESLLKIFPNYPGAAALLESVRKEP